MELGVWDLLIFVALVVLMYGSWPLFHFSKRGIKNVRAYPFLGNMERAVLFKEHLPAMTKRIYPAYPNERYIGAFEFMLPVIWLRDTELIKNVTVKDFDHFTDHRLMISENADSLFSNNIFALKGQKWKDMRSMLSPLFTSSKMRNMLPLILECSSDVADFIDLEVTKHHELKNEGFLEVNVSDLFTRYATDVIATSAFGISVDSQRNKQNDFFSMSKKITDIKWWKFFSFLIFPKIMKWLRVELMDRKMTDFFRSIVSKTIREREESHVIRQDMIHLLMQANKRDEVMDGKDENSTVKRVWTNNELTSQAFLFFLAGFSTISTALSYAAHQLAMSPDVQDRLAAEVDDVHEREHHLTYDVIKRMKYMDMFVSECLRFWPPVHGVDRVCTKPYILPPTNDSSTEVYMMKIGDSLFIPTAAIHKDEKYFPNPEQFDPERFSDDNKASIDPFAYIPFGIGPRSCIGSRFALMEMKAIIFHLVLRFRLQPCSKTKDPYSLPMKLTSAMPDGGMWISMKKR